MTFGIIFKRMRFPLDNGGIGKALVTMKIITRVKMMRCVIGVFSAVLGVMTANGYTDSMSVGGYNLVYEVRTLGDQRLVVVSHVERTVCGEIVIPSKIDGYPVVGIQDKAFEECKRLKAVSIPDSVIVIGARAFSQCWALESVEMPHDLRNLLAYAFYNCSALKSIVIPDGVKKIDKMTFSGCKSLKTVEMSDHITEIGDGAFSRCASLRAIFLSNRLTKIGSGTFDYCSALSDIRVSTANPMYRSVDGCLVSKDGSILIRGPSRTEVTIPRGVTKIEDGAFSGCEAIKSMTVPSCVTEIGASAFAFCKNLELLALPNSIKIMSEEPFNYCEKLKELVIPDGVTTRGLFGETRCRLSLFCCRGLKSLTIPCSVRDINFIGCESLETIRVPKNHPEYQTLDNCLLSKDGKKIIRGPSVAKVRIPKGVTDIGESAFCDCIAVESVVIPEGVMNIGQSAFEDCIGIKSIVIPEGVTNIASSAFDRCKNLKTITIPSSAETIGEHPYDFMFSIYYLSPFNGCSSLVDIQVSKGNPRYRVVDGSLLHKSGAELYRAPSKESVKIPEGVKYIENGAFSGCSALKSLVIPAGVIAVRSSAFKECFALESITLPDSVKEIGELAFGSCKALKNVTMPASRVKVAKRAFEGCCSLETVFVRKAWQEEVREKLEESGLDVDKLHFETNDLVAKEMKNLVVRSGQTKSVAEDSDDKGNNKRGTKGIGFWQGLVLCIVLFCVIILCAVVICRRKGRMLHFMGKCGQQIQPGSGGGNPTPQNDKESFSIGCPNCGKKLEISEAIFPGQHVICPFCEQKFSYEIAQNFDGRMRGEPAQSLGVISCPRCGAQYEIEPDDYGCEVTCVTCNTSFVVENTKK